MKHVDWRILLLPAQVLFLTSLIPLGCDKISSSRTMRTEPAEPPAVVVVPASYREIATSRQRIAQVIPDDYVDLVARVDGYLVKRCFEEGSTVKKGDLVFLIQQEQYTSELEVANGNLRKAQAALDNARIEYERYATLVKSDAVAQKDLDQWTMQKGDAEGDLLVAQGKLGLAKLNVEYTEVRSPIDGKLGVCPFYEGEMVGPGKSEKLGTVIRIDPVKVEFPVPETDYVNHVIEYGSIDKTEAGVTAAIILPNGKKYPHDGTIYFSDNRINNNTGTIIMRARFPNPDAMLVPGGYVKIVLTHKDKKRLLLIPQEAVQRDQTGTFVLLVDKYGVIARRPVALGADLGRTFAVESGLSEGEQVVTRGALKVREGVKPKVTVDAFPEDDLVYGEAAPARDNIGGK